MATVNYRLIMQQLKSSLKKQHLSYARLAQILNVPESTLKKWFVAEDGPFNRINLICEALGLSVYAVIKSAEEQSIQTFTFSKTQQDFFLKDRTTFNVYWLLVYERLDEKSIQKQLGLSPLEFKKSLLKLDKNELIQLGLKDSIRLPRMRPVKWKFEGRFMEELFLEWTNKLIEDNSRNEDTNPLLQYFQLSSASEEEFKKDLEALEEKYARRTIIELNDPSKKLKKIRYFSTHAPGSFIE